MRDIAVRLCLGFLILGFAGCSTIEKKPPSLVFILIDHLGIEATNSYGSKGLVRQNGDLVPYRQPNLEAIAAAGMTFQNAFATPSCAPTRARSLTGRYPFHTRVTQKDRGVRSIARALSYARRGSPCLIGTTRGNAP